MSPCCKSCPRATSLPLAAILAMFAAICTKSMAAQPDQTGVHLGSYHGPQPLTESLDLRMYERIRTEGLAYGKAIDFASALCDGIGPRLTGSPNMKRANEWTLATLATIGLTDARLEDVGEFGVGWYQINSWGRMVSPDPQPIWMQAAVWSVATKGPVSGEIVYVTLTDAGLEAAKGTLKGKIVLLGAMRLLADLDKPVSYRFTDEELGEIEGPGIPRRLTGPSPETPQSVAARQSLLALRQRAVKMMVDEGAAAILLPSRDNARHGDTGIVRDDNTINLLNPGQRRENVLPIPYAVVMIEHYNRLARLAQANVPVTVEVNIQTAFTGDHEHGFNTIAEIPGTDPRFKNQVVMAGGHLDSWPAGTGATDNGAGAAIAMEALRILRSLDVKPKRTIRIALWTGEEGAGGGELGSRNYVAAHFGALTATSDAKSAALKTKKNGELLDAYYNLDEGGGKVRGIYTQGNYAAASIFAQWIAPLKDLGVTAVTNRTAVGSDHDSFNDVGLPGFQFLQDELDYETRTHHTNLDTVDHLHADDLEQAAIVEAIFLWNTSEREAMLPRTPLTHPEDEEKLSTPIPKLGEGTTGAAP